MKQESNHRPADYQAGLVATELSQRCWNGAGLSLSYSFSVFPPKVLIKLNVFQIMYLIIGVYNTKTEPVYLAAETLPRVLIYHFFIKLK